MLPFARCMRHHGVSNFPDSVINGKYPGAQQLGVSSSQYQAAMNACRHLLPNGGNAPNQAELEQQKSALLPFARCVRKHGEPDWPDPSIYTNPNGETAVVFNFIGTGVNPSDLDMGSPQYQAFMQACQHLLPPSNGGPPFRIVRGPH